MYDKGGQLPNSWEEVETEEKELWYCLKCYVSVNINLLLSSKCVGIQIIARRITVLILIK